MKIKDILTINLDEDIKNVIDLEDLSEKEIKEEIDNYIVTDGLAKEFEKFVSTYISNIRETGVWISGFYGSGKSYFGKILGYLLNNQSILGTPARERILQRFTGINDEALIKNSLSRLDAIQSKVVFLDVAKQDTSKGLAFTLFKNFLRVLHLPPDEHGFMLYQLMIQDKNVDVENYIFEKLNKDWNAIKTKVVEYFGAIKKIYLDIGNSEEDFNNILETIRREIDSFDASKLRDQLENYLEIRQEEKLVFLFDEASEAINQQKFTLLDLEGVSEALSSLGNRVWTIAIAQEKLDDVINNSNISKAQLTKVTDRFKTKIHLEATEVDQIIKTRLLKKTNEGIQELKEHFKKHAGQIADHSALIGGGIVKTNNEDSYATYYPFYKNQFDLMQNFLFGSKGYVSTKVAARGMIITTFDILRKEMKDEELFKTVAGWQIARQAQPSPPSRLVNRYDNAERILKEKGSTISGRKLLETINFLTEAEVTPASLDNIIKSYINEPEQHNLVKNDIEKALDILVEHKILLKSSGTYRITSDIEERLLDEMNGYTVQGFVKKKKFVEALKQSELIKNIFRINDSGLDYSFYITTDNDDELTTPSNKSLRIKIKSIYNISDNRSDDIETLKVQHQNDKDLIWLIPDNQSFFEIDKLIEEVERISYLEQKYNNPNSDEGKILLSFLSQKAEKENRIKTLVEKALTNGDLIYLFNVNKLTEDQAVSLIQSQQKEMLKKIYTKRLQSQLSDEMAKGIIKEANNSRLHTYFHGEDFAFFDKKGNFIGEKLKVSEEILYKIRNTFVDGKTLEIELEQPPTGFSLGTVMTTLAVLMRAGRVITKYNGKELFSWKDVGVIDIFSAARNFRKAAFKAVSKSLSLHQKQEIVQFMLDLKAENYIGRKIDYNTNDFDLAHAVRDLAKHFADKVGTLANSEKEFDKLFPDATAGKDFLEEFTGPVSEANYIDRATGFLEQKQKFSDAVKRILNIEKFIRNRLPYVKQWKHFADAVIDELKKAAKPDKEIETLVAEFNKDYSDNIMGKYSNLQQTTQKNRDRYYTLFSEAMEQCAQKYSQLVKMADDLIAEINSLPSGLNDDKKEKAENLKLYAEQRANSKIDLDFDVKDRATKFTYSEVLSFIDLYNSKKSDLEMLKAGLVREKPPEPRLGEKSKPKTFVSKLPGRKLKVSAYKNWLQQELWKMASADDNDEVTIE
ncbi:MAG: hypothetical protein Kow00108_11500 [Calditrichia bacterium]